MINDGVETQMAVLGTTMVKPEPVFLPLGLMRDDRTLHTHVRDARGVLRCVELQTP